MGREICRKLVRSIRILDRRVLILKLTRVVCAQALGSDLVFPGDLATARRTDVGQKVQGTAQASCKAPFLWFPANIAAGPLGFQAGLDVDPQGERSCSRRGLRTDRADPTAISDEKNLNPSQITSREREGGTSRIARARNLDRC